ncbi:unnamed protein product, partial [Amoebophrya sp. A120]
IICSIKLDSCFAASAPSSAATRVRYQFETAGATCTIRIYR